MTHLALDTDTAAAADRLAALAQALPEGRRVQVGAEDAARCRAILGCVLDVAGRGLADRLGATVQANLLRSPSDADALVEPASTSGSSRAPTSRRPARTPSERRRTWRFCASASSWPNAARPGRRPPTTAGSARRCCSRTARCGVEQLFGVRPEVLGELHARGVPTRVYVPYGPNWYRYWMRRVAESRGA